MVVDSAGRIDTIPSMSLLGGSLLVPMAAVAVAARAAAPVRVILPDCNETLLDRGTILEGADLSWLQE
jgi:hypothetical protein